MSSAAARSSRDERLPTSCAACRRRSRSGRGLRAARSRRRRPPSPPGTIASTGAADRHRLPRPSTRSTAASAARRSFLTPPRSGSRCSSTGRQATPSASRHRDRRRSTRWAGGRSTTRRTAASSATRDAPTGEQPNGEKLLDVNASLLDLYLDAAETLELAALRSNAPRTSSATCRHWLADQVDGGWAASQHADPAYHAAEARRTAARPHRRSIARSSPTGTR